MKRRYWLCKRSRIFYLYDSETGRRESLRTRNHQEAEQLLHVKEEAVKQPSHLNLAIAKAYLAAFDPKLSERTWGNVMEVFCARGKESTRRRRQRAIQSKPFSLIHNKKLVSVC